MRTLHFTAQCDLNPTVENFQLAQQQVTHFLVHHLGQHGFEALPQGAGKIAITVEQYELPLSVSCEANTDKEQHMVCSITSYPEEEQDWLDRIAEQSLLNQLAHAVEATLKANPAFSEFKWT